MSKNYFLDIIFKSNRCHSGGYIGLIYSNFDSPRNTTLELYFIYNDVNSVSLVEWQNLPKEVKIEYLTDYQAYLNTEDYFNNTFLFPREDILQEIEWETQSNWENFPIGYKYLNKIEGFVGGIYLSPLRKSKWYGNKLKSDFPPTIRNSNGIYSCKNKFYCGLVPYRNLLVGEYGTFDTKMTQLVKLRLYGKIIDSEFGFRSEYAEIIEEVNLEDYWDFIYSSNILQKGEK